ncbi:Hypothetical protein A7982_04138 [Minicystis rosea]|nr:Hypothetical protein A7982_04138 [Minicystis rosea]
MIATNKSIVCRLVEDVIQRGQLDLVPDLFSPDYVPHDPSNPARRGGHEGARAFIEMLHAGLSEIGYAVDLLIAEGDLVSYRFTLSGVHTGPFMGVPPTGKRISVGGVDIFRLTAGKIVESWVYADALGMLIQLGVIPPPAA